VTTHSVDLRELLRIDIEAELRKLTVAQLQGPWQLPAELVRRAIRAGASEIDVELSRSSCTVRDNGPPLPDTQLRDLATMLDPGAPRERRHHALLALEAAGGLALLALAGLGATQLDLRARGGGKCRRLLWRARQGPPTLSEETDRSGPRGTEIVLRGAEIDGAQARTWLRDVGRFAPGVLRENGELINTGLRSYLACEPFSLGPAGQPTKLHGHVAVAAHGEQARVWLLHGGVIATHLGLSAVPCFDAIVELGAITPVQATAADLRAAVQPHVTALADLGVGLLMHIATRLPDLDSPTIQARILTLLLQAVRTRRRLRELMQVPMLPCWTPHDPEQRHALPARWLRLAELTGEPTSKPSGEPTVLLALYPEQDPANHALPDAPVLRLDAAERSALTELFGLRFRAPPLRSEGGGDLRARLRRGLHNLRDTLTSALHLGPGAPLPDTALRPDERELLNNLRAVLPAGRSIVLCAGHGSPHQFGGPKGQLRIGRDHPDLLACLAAMRRGPAWTYPACLTLLAGMPASSARASWLRHWQDP
jgi:hypothetical protein